ncbi:YkvS family protein [Lysinibacillus xylanilyticus]|uniref:DUF2187 family protein n=1 Tax=Lysinibacillus TaxID=400634 RepID=UPI002B24E0B4|nr:DUF2187 family protein [Lysinibacillus xylanilyticus]MEB2301585.1 YkvS family protein [Lysinibacillus xylanilyticus]
MEKISKTGDLFKFTRNNIPKVIAVRPATVMVELPTEYAEMLKLPNHLTVVNHKNYRILRKSSLSLRDRVS